MMLMAGTCSISVDSRWLVVQCVHPPDLLYNLPSSSPQDHSSPALLCCQPREMALFLKLMLPVLSLTALPSCPLLLLYQVLSVKQHLGFSDRKCLSLVYEQESLAGLWAICINSSDDQEKESVHRPYDLTIGASVLNCPHFPAAPGHGSKNQR